MKYFSRAAFFLHLSQIICFVAGFEGNQTFFDNSAAQKKCIDQCPPPSDGYTKQTKKWCRTKLKGKPMTDNLEQAKKLCSQYSDCVGVYDFKCDNKGTLGYCKVGHSFSGSSSSCVYTKNSMKGSSDIQSNGDVGTSDEEVDPDLPVVQTVEPTNSDEAESNVAFTFNEDNSTDRSRYHIIFVTGVVCAILVHILRSKQCSGFTSGYHKTTYETLL